MKWYQTNIEGSIPTVRTSHTSTILNKIDATSSHSCIVIYGGKTQKQTNLVYTDLAFLSVGSGVSVNEEIAKPQNQTSMGKLNKILGSGASSVPSVPVQPPPTQRQPITIGGDRNNSNTASSFTPPAIQKQSPSSSSSSSSASSSSSPSSSSQSRKTYSKLPVYSGSVIYNWENSTSEGDVPGNRFNHSLTALNSGSYKGKIILIGGVINNSNNSNNNLRNELDTINNDIFLLDCDTNYWVKIQAIGIYPEARHSHYVCQISNETILLFGGINDSNQVLNDTHLLNLSNQNTIRWTQPNSMNNAPDLKGKEYKVCFCSGAIYVIISNSNEMYKLDTSTFKWSQVCFVGTLPKFQMEWSSITSYLHYLVFLIENEIYFFDTIGLEWTELDVDGDRPTKRKGHSINVVGSILVVIGGQCEFPLSTIMARDIEVIDLTLFFYKKKK
ncbi:hypothetical protein CYY_004660 [Polysphondylium violaceum]|uniref:Kelch repeat-containing protein n=1 Tax=Polysphondylium violaceum TaxID=133409 RepID=A0A8J4PV31_9MYCE|nr:hypothetical protein CYY_004660 [Polysphondylium violaceum]